MGIVGGARPKTKFPLISSGSSSEVHGFHGTVLGRKGTTEQADKSGSNVKDITVYILSDSIAKNIEGIKGAEVIPFPGINLCRLTAKIDKFHALMSKPVTIIHRKMPVLLTILMMFQLIIEGRHIIGDGGIEKRQACSTIPTYDIKCHGSCPRVDTSDWAKNKNFKECVHPKTYHCVYLNETYAIEGCAEPIFCNRGEEPLLYNQGNSFKVECRHCNDMQYFNSEKRKSDTFSECYQQRRKCNSKYGEEECDKSEGMEMFFTQTKCTCKWKDNYVPEGPDATFCSPETRCIWRKCEYKNQTRLSDFDCHQACEEGMVRINDSIACLPEPIARNVTGTSSNGEDLTSAFTFSSTQPSTSTRNPDKESKEADDDWKPGYTIIAVAGALLVVVVNVIGIYCCCTKGKENEPAFCSNIHCCYKHQGNKTKSRDQRDQRIPLVETDSGEKKLETKLQGTSLTVRDVGRKVMDRNVSILKENMAPNLLKDKLREKRVFDEMDLKDLEDLTKTSDKNAFIFKQMYDKYILREDKYNQFKTCLRKIDLGFLVDELEKSEDVIILESRNEQREETTV